MQGVQIDRLARAKSSIKRANDTALCAKQPLLTDSPMTLTPKLLAALVSNVDLYFQLEVFFCDHSHCRGNHQLRLQFTDRKRTETDNETIITYRQRPLPTDGEE